MLALTSRRATQKGKFYDEKAGKGFHGATQATAADIREPYPSVGYSVKRKYEVYVEHMKHTKIIAEAYLRDLQGRDSFSFFSFPRLLVDDVALSYTYA